MNPPAGFWRRYAAYSLDLAVVAGLASLLLWPRWRDGGRLLSEQYLAVQRQLMALMDASYGVIADPLSLALDWSRDEGLRAAMLAMSGTLDSLALWTVGGVVALAALWFVGFEASAWQATPGKRALGLRVTDKAGGRCGPGRTAGRFVAGTPSWLLLNLGHAIAAWTPDKRALHDYLAGTRVELAPGARPAMPGWARAWLALQLLATLALLGYGGWRYLQLLWLMAGN